MSPALKNVETLIIKINDVSPFAKQVISEETLCICHREIFRKVCDVAILFEIPLHEIQNGICIFGFAGVIDALPQICGPFQPLPDLFPSHQP